MNGFAAIDSKCRICPETDKAGKPDVLSCLYFKFEKNRILRNLLFESNIRSKQGTAVPMSHFLHGGDHRLSKQCTEVPTHAKLVGQHPKPFNNFREIGYAPMALISAKVVIDCLCHFRLS